ncbi:tetratricopeptide repeat protein [Leptolyngbya sp. FACHB-541]|uniref:CHAT domain-containing protein n=1 Tax=Leptolyngbya sp. FACHB-541 TaxID=2692810 RepID=UPI00168707A9|nr:tetratricopeptide repeat protein [Leptolyngbya sp. FACHB-541]MBD2001426.1 tetratricopeptide repeat protein [Leptolyngbya sp. FACHB-541]
MSRNPTASPALSHRKLSLGSLLLLLSVALPLAWLSPLPPRSGIAVAQIPAAAHEAEANRLYELGEQQYNVQQWRQAVQSFESALEHYQMLGNQQRQAHTLSYLGSLHQSLGEYTQALDYHQQSLALLRQLGNRSGEASSLNNVGLVYESLGEYPQALDSFEQSLALFRQLSDRLGEASSLNNIGLVYRQLEEYPQSLDYYEQSLALSRQLGDRPGEALTLGNIGTVYRQLEDYPQALEYYEQSLALKRQLGDRPGEASSLIGIGIVYQSLGEYPQALDSFEQSLALSRQLGDRPGEANTLGNIGIVYRQLGEYPQALEYYEQSLALKRQLGDRPGEALTLGNIGTVYASLGEYPQALDYYQQSLALSRQLGNRPGEASSLNNIGIVYQALGEYLQSLDYYQQSLALFRQLGNRAGEAKSLNNIGHVYQALGDYPQALEYYQQSLALFRQVGDRAGEAITLGNMGAVFEAQTQPELAIVFYKEAINAYEQIRQINQALEKNLQDSYTATVEDTYRHLADLLLQQDRILESQRVLDLLKVQELDQYLRGVRSSENARQGAELVPPETVIANAHNDLINRAIANGQRLHELEAKDSLTDAELDELAALQADQRQIVQAFNAFKDSALVQEQLALLSQEERDRNVQLDELAALQDNLGQIPQGAVMLYPLILENRLELIVTSPYAPPIHRTVNDVSRLELNDAVQAFRYALEEPTRDAITPAQTFYQWLIAPIEADLEAAGINTIIYAPDRSLRYIPLAALHDGNQWLAERYRINHITAASLTDLNTPPRTQPQILAGALTEGPLTVNVGNQTFNFNLLEHADDEINHIAGLTSDGTALLGNDFNRARIERDANRHTIVHLATHAQFLVGQPEDSFILFSQQERWTLADFKAGLLNLTRVDLVVLSACETGVDNTFGDGEEILGFGYLMQTAGARASMASLWAVDDGGTQILMTEFYDALLRGNLGKAAALQQAQIALISMGEDGNRGGFELAEAIGLDPNDLSHPHYWAPFILIGNGL